MSLWLHHAPNSREGPLKSASDVPMAQAHNIHMESDMAAHNEG